MLAEPLAALASAGATALIGAIATDAWQGARAGFVRLLGRGGDTRGAAIAAQLDEDAGTVTRTGPDETDQVRQELLPVWRRRLAQLLADDPDAEAELRELIAEVSRELPAGPRAWVQTNVARDNSTLFAVQDGDLHYHHTPTGQVPPPPTGDRERGA